MSELVLPPRPDDAESLMRLVSWGVDTAAGQGWDLPVRAGLPLGMSGDGVRMWAEGRYRTAWLFGGDPDRIAELHRRYVLWPVLALAAIGVTRGVAPTEVDPFDPTPPGVGPLALWADAMDTLASGDQEDTSPAARRVARRTVQDTGPDALAQGREWHDLLRSALRQREHVTTTTPAGPSVVPVWFN
jgi:hypothetical protein